MNYFDCKAWSSLCIHKYHKDHKDQTQKKEYRCNKDHKFSYLHSAVRV